VMWARRMSRRTTDLSPPCRTCGYGLWSNSSPQCWQDSLCSGECSVRSDIRGPSSNGIRCYSDSIFPNQSYATCACRRPIKMSLLCQLEMTLPGGFAELTYEPSVRKRARSNKGSGFVGRCIRRRASAALRRGSAPARRLIRTTVTSLSGRDGDICIGRTHIVSAQG
jgi:hypothetical protein